MRLDQVAAQTWNRDRPIGETSAAIHDGAQTTPELIRRAKMYVEEVLLGNFPQAVPDKDAMIMEVGSGLGWLMQGVNDYLVRIGRAPRTITGLDIAPRMIEQAKQRLGTSAPFTFAIYDGINIPVPDGSLDLLYSAAALQHVPRPYVFNLFFEFKRLLKREGFAVFHLLSTDCLLVQEKVHPWRLEIQNQVSGSEAHWHHFYTKQELVDVLRITGFEYVAVLDDNRGALVACVSKTPLHLPDDFSSEKYLELNGDVRNANGDPIKHWLEFGHQEGRRWRE